MKSITQKYFLLSAVAMLFFRPDVAKGEMPWLVTSLALKAEYNDNIFFDASGEMDDFITTISPGLRLQKKTERLDAHLSALLDGVYYADNDDLDAWDQLYGVGIKYKMTPRMGVGATGNYKKDSRTDRDIEETGLTLNTETRERQYYTLLWDYLLADERTTVALSYGYTDEDFKDTDFRDYTSHKGFLSFNRDLMHFTRPSVGLMNFGYTRYDYPDHETENYIWTVGFDQDLSETKHFHIDVGPRFTRYKSDTTGQEEDDWGGTGRISFASKGEYTRGKISLSQERVDASGRNRTTDRTRLTGKVTRRFLERFWGYLVAGYYINKYDYDLAGTHDLEERTFRINPGIRYDFTHDLVLDGSYLYTTTKEEETDIDRDRSLVFLKLSYRYSL